MKKIFLETEDEEKTLFEWNRFSIPIKKSLGNVIVFDYQIASAS